MIRSEPFIQKRAQLFFISFAALILASFYFLKIVIGPFILALSLAYVFNPWIESLERRRYRRSVVVSTALVLSTIAFVIAFWFIVPAVYHQLQLLWGLLPGFKIHVENYWLSPLNIFLRDKLGPNFSDIQFPSIIELLPDMNPNLFMISGLGTSTKVLISWLIAIILAPAFAYFVMRDYRRISLKVLSVVPPDLRSTFLKFLSNVDHTLRAVLRGQILLVTALAVFYSMVFFFAGLPAGLVVGLITGFARLVPYADIVVGGTLCFLILVTNASPLPIVVAVAVGFLLVQLCDVFFLTPRIMGQFSGLHPFIIVIAILCFADWFGFYGVLLAIPMAAVGRVTLVTLFDAYKRSRFYRNELDGIE